MASYEVSKKRRQVLLISLQSRKYPPCFVVRVAQRARHDDNTHRYVVSVHSLHSPLTLNSLKVFSKHSINRINEFIFVVFSPLNWGLLKSDLVLD